MLPFGADSEYGMLKAVLLAKPRSCAAGAVHPRRVLHLKALHEATLKREYGRLVKTYRRLGIKTFFIRVRPGQAGERLALFNIMFTRDLFFMTPRGCILSRMSLRVRRDEVIYAAGALRALGVPVLYSVAGGGTFEGADALWVNDRLVVIGVGRRTNREGFRQVKEVLARQRVDGVHVPAPKRTRHLLGAVQRVAPDLAFVREALVDGEILRLLKKNKVDVIPVRETREVALRQALNVVVTAPRRIIMPAGCPATRRMYEQAGLTVEAEVPVSQFVRAAGGLACAAGVIARRL
ncbi:MAG: arginine deiminase family protein [Candidatus Omnitrophica bacterium]|nr:arginine deiminase family protein [Candidatus Omnitrophota bacterium]MDD5573578.1 arginine deiminase family protein [Candidatus Omnitrophota bacterium]